MQKDDFENKKVFFQENSWAKNGIEKSIKNVLADIRKGHIKERIMQLRTLVGMGDLEKYNELKKTLPGVTFSSTFVQQRKTEFLKEYTNIMVLDIDKLSLNEILRIKNGLSNDAHIIAFWDSPSGKGIKGLIELKYDFELQNVSIPELHKQSFDFYTNYFKDKHGCELDKSGSDVTRLCFYSYDPEMYICSEIVPFLITKDNVNTVRENKNKSVVSRHNNSNVFNKYEKCANENVDNNRNTINSILRFLERKNRSITSSYFDWCKVAFTLSNLFSFEVGRRYFHRFSALDFALYNQNNCDDFFEEIYRNTKKTHTIFTIIKLAQDKGYNDVSARKRR